MDKQVIFFDGVCNLCNFFVDFVVERDAEEKFQFAPLQGETAKRTLPDSQRANLRTVVLWNQGQHFQRSDAALMVLQQLGGWWGALRVFWGYRGRSGILFIYWWHETGISYSGNARLAAAHSGERARFLD